MGIWQREGAMLKLRLFAAGAAAALAGGVLGQSPTPDLIAIKAAAEGGNPKAQYDYAKAIPYPRMTEQVDWYLKSARAGYAPAQDALGNYFLTQVFDQRTRIANMRQSVLWSSRAAYQGVMWSQARIAGYYRKGEVLPRDLVAAYVWYRVAEEASPLQLSYRGELNQLITEMSSAEIAAAESRYRSFRLQRFSGLNPVEADLFFAQLKVTGIFVVNGARQVVLGNTRVHEGESQAIDFSGESVRVVCLKIQDDGVLFGIAGTSYTRWLKL
jgi:hypothetical protein